MLPKVSPSQLLPLLLLSLLPTLPVLSAPLDNLNPPRGNFAELHSCEVFAGPCVVNSEVNMGTSYSLRVWQFDQGTLNGVPLAGKVVALLEKSGENLADCGHASDAVAYLPPGLSPAQRAALVTWARQSTAAQLDDARIKIAALGWNLDGQRVHFSAGQDVSFEGDGAPPCTDGTSCGAMLWYQPRIPSTNFTVDQLGQSKIVEPLLSLHWMDHGRRTLFVGRFGDPDAAIPALCGAPQTASL